MQITAKFWQKRRIGATIFLLGLLIAVVSPQSARGQTPPKWVWWMVFGTEKYDDPNHDSRADLSDVCIPNNNNHSEPWPENSLTVDADGKVKGECHIDDWYGGTELHTVINGTLSGQWDAKSNTLSFTGSSNGESQTVKGQSQGIDIKYVFSYSGSGTSDSGTIKFNFSISGNNPYTVPSSISHSASGSMPYRIAQKIQLTTGTTEATVCQAPPRITSQQIDAYLDFLAAQLQFAVEKAETYTFAPFVMDARPFRFTPKDAADLGRAVWDQAHALQKKHVERELTLNDAQKKRTKAFGHWADWLERRAKTKKKTFRGEVIEVYEQPEKPPYPLFGPITQDVPTPPQLKGEDIFVVNVPWWGPEAITVDYAWAGFWTVAQGADMWYTRGLFWTTYIALSNESIAPVALSALQRIPYFGPVFTAAFVSAVELNSWTEIGLLRKYLGEAPLTWDQHLANYATLTNLGIAAALRTFPSLNKVSLWAGGLDEGKIGPDITAKFGEGKSFRVASERTDAQGNKYQTIEYALLGPTKANPDNKLSFPTAEFRVVNAKDGTRYFTVQANGELDQPVFFLGQKGYHAWKHLTEINAGQKTKFEDEALLQVFAGKKNYLDELRAIEKTMLDPTQSLDAANKQYMDFTNRLIADASFTRVSGFYQWKNRDGSLAPAEANFFVMVPKDCGANAPVATFPVRVSVDPTNGRLMGLFVLKPHDPTAAFMPEAKISVAPSAYWAWARDVDKYLYEFAPLRNYMPAR